MLSGVAGAVLGRNAAFFPDGAGLMTEEGAPVEVGVEMKSVFALPDGLIATKTPAGSAARVTHWGAYNKLPDAHQALHRHCARHEWRITGVNWEVYGDWSDEPAKVRTDIYYQLV
jgi:predicted transcriptional regulator YdeE